MSNALAPLHLPRGNAVRRFARWLLLGWLLTMACAGSAPVIPSIMPKLDCVTHKARGGEALQGVSGVVQCSLCLPVAPPAPELPLLQQVERVSKAEPAVIPNAGPFVQPMVLPPARAPPLFS